MDVRYYFNMNQNFYSFWFSFTHFVYWSCFASKSLKLAVIIGTKRRSIQCIVLSIKLDNGKSVTIVTFRKLDKKSKFLGCSLCVLVFHNYLSIPQNFFKGDSLKTCPYSYTLKCRQISNLLTKHGIIFDIIKERSHLILQDHSKQHQ